MWARRACGNRSLLRPRRPVKVIAIQLHKGRGRLCLCTMASLDEEIEAMLAIFPDAWYLNDPSGATFACPVPFADGAVTVSCTLPRGYPYVPGILPSVTIDGAPPALTVDLLHALSIKGLIASPGMPVDSLAATEIAPVAPVQVLFDIVTFLMNELRPSIDSADFVEVGPEAALDAEPVDDGDPPEWQKFELAKISRRAASASLPILSECHKSMEAAPAIAKHYGKDAYIARLRSGETVSFREGGNSMTPRIKSRQLCTYAPVLTAADVSEGDAVFCKVGGAYYTHLVVRKQLVRRSSSGEDEYRFQIGNNHGHINGWTTLEKIYGRVICVAP